MSRKIGDFAIGAIVIAAVFASVAYYFTRRDDCLDKARKFVSTQAAITAKVGKVTSVGTSSWLSGQAASKRGERTFYFLLKGERAATSVVVSADVATCTCRLESMN
jgi:hypothetical protein